MASIFKATYKRPIPEGAEFFTRKGVRKARWKNAKGKTQTAPLSDDQTEIVLEYKHYTIKYVGPDGKRVKVRGYTDRAATEEKARGLEKAAERTRAGLVTFDRETIGKPLTDAVDEWTDDLRRRGKSASYVYNMGLLMKKLGKECGWPTIGSIRSDSLTRWLASPKQAHLSARSQNQYLETARAFINWCCAQNPPWLPGNALAKVEAADETEKRREKRALTLDELDRLRKASGNRWVVYLTAALSGLRRSELKRLRWGDVHFEGEMPHIQLRAEATKAKRADTVPINPELLEALRCHRPKDATDGQPVFKSIPKYSTYKKDVVERAKIPWRDERNRLASFHCLRKTFATYLALADVPIRVAMDMMRVTDAKLLTDTYTDAKLFNTSAAAARLPQLQRPEGEAGAPNCVGE